jgi:hypothetical protein
LECEIIFNMTVEQLRTLMESGKFHHGTYRCAGTLWEGLWIYERSTELRGFVPAGFFPRGSTELEAAMELVRSTGISVGAYGQG